MSKQHVSRFAAIGLNPKRLEGLRSRKWDSARLGKFRAVGPGKRLEGAARQAVVDRLRVEGQIA